jgi:hypothetical protein
MRWRAFASPPSKTMSNRPKTVFDRSELAHIWASQSQPYGKARTTNMSFRDSLILSYSTGIGRLCKFRGKPYALINIHSFGPTTAQHVGDARHAVSHMRTFCGDWGSYGTDLNQTPKEIVEYYRNEAKAMAEKTSRYRHKQYKLHINAARAYAKASSAAEFFGMGTAKLEAERQKCLTLAEPLREVAEAFDDASKERTNRRRRAKREKWKKMNAEWVREQEALLNAFLADHTVEDIPSSWSVPDERKAEYDAQVRKRKEWEVESAKERLEAWARGEEVLESGFYSSPVRLRVRPITMQQNLMIVGEVQRDIETSHGAVIPYEEGRKCYRFCARLWRQDRGWQRNGEKFMVGSYHLDLVTSDGIKAGCHHIHRQEIERFAAQEGWIQSEADSAGGQPQPSNSLRDATQSTEEEKP